MMLRFFALTLTLAIATAASGKEADPPPAIALPDTGELASFASENWWDWGARLARFAGRSDQPTELSPTKARGRWRGGVGSVGWGLCSWFSIIWPFC